jgi:hypothetical protein
MLLAGALATVAGGCSSPKSSGTTPATQPTPSVSVAVTSAPVQTEPASSSTQAPSGTAAESTSATTGTSTGTATDDTAAITAAFTTFFDGLDPDTNAKIAVLEHGDLLGPMVVDAAQDPQFQQLSTMVNSVELLSDAECSAAKEATPCALVHHDLFVGGLPAMVDLKSHAVRVDGVWKVSASTWCAVVTIGGAACPDLPAG